MPCTMGAAIPTQHVETSGASRLIRMGLTLRYRTLSDRNGTGRSNHCETVPYREVELEE